MADAPIISVGGGSFSVTSNNGAAIGGGFASVGSAATDRIDIASGTFELVVSGNGTGIGSGSGNASVRTVAVTGGRFWIASARGAGIGTSFFEGGPSEGIAGSSVTLSGCDINVSSGDVCIGWTSRPATSETHVPSVTFGGEPVALECHPTTGFGIRAASLSFGATSSLHATVFGGGARLFSDAPPSLSESAALFIQYGQENETENVTGLAVGHVTFPEERIYQLSFDRVLSDAAPRYRVAHFDAGRCKAFVAYLPAAGTYQISAKVNETYCSAGRVYQPSENNFRFAVDGASFVAHAVGICSGPTGEFSGFPVSTYRRRSVIMLVVLYSTFITA